MNGMLMRRTSRYAACQKQPVAKALPLSPPQPLPAGRKLGRTEFKALDALPLYPRLLAHWQKTKQCSFSAA
jgi:hypothetical protein